MPTAPDYTWTILLDKLKDNNEGAINEELIRAVARFARPSYALAGASGVTSLSWIGTINVASPTPTESPRYTKLLEVDAYNRAENYLSVGNLGFLYSGGGGATDNVAASRLVQYGWTVELFSGSLEHCGIGWYYLPNAGTWPTNAKRLRFGHLYTQTGWTVSGGTSVVSGVDQQLNRSGVGYLTVSSGNSAAVLNPGDQLIPILEHYGPTNALSSPKLSFQFNLICPGVVNEWVSPPQVYYDSASDITLDTTYPLSQVPRRTGLPSAT